MLSITALFAAFIALPMPVLIGAILFISVFLVVLVFAIFRVCAYGKRRNSAERDWILPLAHSGRIPSTVAPVAHEQERFFIPALLYPSPAHIEKARDYYGTSLPKTTVALPRPRRYDDRPVTVLPVFPTSSAPAPPSSQEPSVINSSSAAISSSPTFSATADSTISSSAPPNVFSGPASPASSVSDECAPASVSPASTSSDEECSDLLTPPPIGSVKCPGAPRLCSSQFVPEHTPIRISDTSVPVESKTPLFPIVSDDEDDIVPGHLFAGKRAPFTVECDPDYSDYDDDDDDFDSSSVSFSFVPGMSLSYDNPTYKDRLADLVSRLPDSTGHALRRTPAVCTPDPEIPEPLIKQWYF